MPDPWYALHVMSCRERQVSTRLEHLEVESFYPHWTERSEDRRREVEHRLFPGYVFARLNDTSRHTALTLPGVVRLVGCGSHPVALPDLEMEAIQSLALSPVAPLAKACPFLSYGDHVRVMWGPAVGIVGQVWRVKKRTRVVVVVEMLAAARCIEVDRNSIEVIPHDSGRRAEFGGDVPALRMRIYNGSAGAAGSLAA